MHELLARLDQAAGWCGVFWSRDPDGMRACLDGAEVPPWDVVQALLHDLAADVGVGVAEAETGRARALHAASVAAYDDRPGGREILSDRLDMMLQEQRFALEREQELARSLALAATPDEVDRVHLDLAWVRDDHERAAARCAELRARMERLDRERAPKWVADFGGGGTDGGEPSADVRRGRAPAPRGRLDAGGVRDARAARAERAERAAREAYGAQEAQAAPDGYGAYAAESERDTHAGRVPPDGFDAQGVGDPQAAYDHDPHAAYDPHATPDARDGFEARDAYDARDAYGPEILGSAAASAPAPDAASRTLEAPEEPEAPEAADAPKVPAQASPRSRRRDVRRRPRGARFAGLDGTGDGAAEPVPAPVAGEPATPRGARYVQAVDAAPRAHPEPGAQDADGADDERVTVDAVRALIRLRGEGRSGEAHGVLVEAAGWPPARLPLFAEELHHAGLGADWATLLWEAASLPPDQLVAVADALAGAGRAEDCRKLLRQGVARPAPEIAESLLALIDAGREREARALLDSYVRVRSAEDVAACAHTDPQRLIPLLIATAKAVSDDRHWDLVHALRVAGFTT
ncbi:hypothetical protein RB200_02120 [Streptomyces sp. PmtG]